MFDDKTQHVKPMKNCRKAIKNHFSTLEMETTLKSLSGLIT